VAARRGIGGTGSGPCWFHAGLVVLMVGSGPGEALAGVGSSGFRWPLAGELELWIPGDSSDPGRWTASCIVEIRR